VGQLFSIVGNIEFKRERGREKKRGGERQREKKRGGERQRESDLFYLESSDVFFVLELILLWIVFEKKRERFLFQI
jgi:hypothetical protein